jgi:hypothetical protein
VLNLAVGWPPIVVWWWIAAGSGALIWLAVVRSHGRNAPEDLGTVSPRWLAEQRANERHYPGR